MFKNICYAFLFVSINLGCTHQLPDFATRLSTRLPSTNTPESIGEYSLGCLKGAQTFTGKELGLVISQMKRGRYWGHPSLVQLITNAGLEFSKSKKLLVVGDLSQSRGGPTLFGHNSHQNGLDVDIWFKVFEDSQRPALLNLETDEMKSVEELSADQVKMIKYFTSDANVERIFINPKFKKFLCQNAGKLNVNSSQLHKLRAWYGHDDHIHVRMFCPADSPKCISQAPVPEGEGCGEELDWWFSEEAKNSDKDSTENELKGIYLEKIKKLPLECDFYSI